MAWISVHEDVMGPKLREFIKKSGLSGNEALGSLVKLWLWGIKNADPSGLIISADRGDIADVISAGSGLSDKVKPSKVVDGMVESGWIDDRDGNLYLHDWDEWQEMYYRFIEKREKDTARKRRAREAERAAAEVQPPPPALPTPPPTPDPAPPPPAAPPEEPVEKPKKTTKPKPDKKKYAEFVRMTEEEYGKLVVEFGEEAAKRMVEVLNNYKGASGKTYKSDYLAILNWVVKRVKEESPGIIKSKPAGPPVAGQNGSPVPEEWRNLRRGEA